MYTGLSPYEYMHECTFKPQTNCKRKMNRKRNGSEVSDLDLASSDDEITAVMGENEEDEDQENIEKKIQKSIGYVDGFQGSRTGKEYFEYLSGTSVWERISRESLYAQKEVISAVTVEGLVARCDPVQDDPHKDQADLIRSSMKSWWKEFDKAEREVIIVAVENNSLGTRKGESYFNKLGTEWKKISRAKMFTERERTPAVYIEDLVVRPSTPTVYSYTTYRNTAKPWPMIENISTSTTNSRWGGTATASGQLKSSTDTAPPSVEEYDRRTKRLLEKLVRGKSSRYCIAESRMRVFRLAQRAAHEQLLLAAADKDNDLDGSLNSTLLEEFDRAKKAALKLHIDGRIAANGCRGFPLEINSEFEWLSESKFISKGKPLNPFADRVVDEACDWTDYYYNVEALNKIIEKRILELEKQPRRYKTVKLDFKNKRYLQHRKHIFDIQTGSFRDEDSSVQKFYAAHNRNVEQFELLIEAPYHNRFPALPADEYCALLAYDAQLKKIMRLRYMVEEKVRQLRARARRQLDQGEFEEDLRVMEQPLVSWKERMTRRPHFRKSVPPFPLIDEDGTVERGVQHVWFADLSTPELRAIFTQTATKHSVGNAVFYAFCDGRCADPLHVKMKELVFAKDDYCTVKFYFIDKYISVSCTVRGHTITETIQIPKELCLSQEQLDAIGCESIELKLLPELDGMKWSERSPDDNTLYPTANSSSPLVLPSGLIEAEIVPNFDFDKSIGYCFMDNYLRSHHVPIYIPQRMVHVQSAVSPEQLHSLQTAIDHADKHRQSREAYVQLKRQMQLLFVALNAYDIQRNQCISFRYKTEECIRNLRARARRQVDQDEFEELVVVEEPTVLSHQSLVSRPSHRRLKPQPFEEIDESGKVERGVAHAWYVIEQSPSSGESYQASRTYSAIYKNLSVLLLCDAFTEAYGMHFKQIEHAFALADSATLQFDFASLTATISCSVRRTTVQETLSLPSECFKTPPADIETIEIKLLTEDEGAKLTQHPPTPDFASDMIPTPPAMVGGSPLPSSSVHAPSEKASYQSDAIRTQPTQLTLPPPPATVSGTTTTTIIAGTGGSGEPTIPTVPQLPPLSTMPAAPIRSFEEALAAAPAEPPKVLVGGRSARLLDNIDMGDVLDAGRAVVDVGLMAAENLPVLGAAAILLQELIGVCDNYRCNKLAFVELKKRLQYLYDLYFAKGGIADIAQRKGQQSILAPFAQRMEDILNDAIAYLTTFTKKGFFGKLLSGRKPAERFQGIDSDLTQCLNELNVALQLQQMEDDVRSYEAIVDIQSKVDQAGGLEGLQKMSKEELQKLGEDLGVTDLDELKQEVNDCQQRIENAVGRVEGDVQQVKDAVVGQDKVLMDIKQYIMVIMEAQQQGGLGHNNNNNNNNNNSNGPSPQKKEKTSNDANLLQMYRLTERPEIDHRRILGRGSYGCVYKGRYRGATVAVKEMILPSHMFTSAMLTQLQDEVRLQLKVSTCPGVVQILGIALQPNAFVSTPCILMECAIGSLHNAIHRHTPHVDLSLPNKLTLMLQVASTLEYFSSVELIHRDIKSSNILLFSSPEDPDHVCAKVCDFGLSKVTSSTSMGMSSQQTAKGTPSYMAPETFEMQYSTASDVYSFTVMLNEVLMEALPFPDMSPMQLVGALYKGKRPLLYDSPGELGNGLRELIRRGWHQEPEKRLSFSEITSSLGHLVKSALNVACYGTRRVDMADVRKVIANIQSNEAAEGGGGGGSIGSGWTSAATESYASASTISNAGGMMDSPGSFSSSSSSTGGGGGRRSSIEQHGIQDLSYGGGAAGTGTRPLEDMSIDEVGQLMEAIGLVPLKGIFVDKKVSGLMLSYCEEPEDLLSNEYGVSSKALARGLIKRIVKWRDEGVPYV